MCFLVTLLTLTVFSVFTPAFNMPVGVPQGSRTFNGASITLKEKNITLDIFQCERLIIIDLKMKHGDTNSSSKTRPIYSKINDWYRYQIVAGNEKIEISRNGSVIENLDGASGELLFRCNTDNALWKVFNDCSNGLETTPCDISCLPDACKEEYVDAWKEEEVEKTNITKSAGQHVFSSTGLIGLIIIINTVGALSS
ncbi:uncharacterized protein LOC135138140 isoform X2 [Zophobas morio]|uniref:uncharacterized protein LOC135138140 isoform X2 n=1 Tax=Zophobas morio TaxID=2755281 RepID=UPI003082A586